MSLTSKFRISHLPYSSNGIKLTAVFLLLLFFSGCVTKDTGEGDEVSFDRSFIDEHNARNSLDWFGLYRGVLPCADCEGIETEVVLHRDETFVRRTSYLGKGDGRVFEESGDFIWNEEGNTVIFQGIEPPNSFFVAESYLIHLDKEGEIITGELAESYMLRKVPGQSSENY